MGIFYILGSPHLSARGPSRVCISAAPWTTSQYPSRVARLLSSVHLVRRVGVDYHCICSPWRRRRCRRLFDTNRCHRREPSWPYGSTEPRILQSLSTESPVELASHTLHCTPNPLVRHESVVPGGGSTTPSMWPRAILWLSSPDDLVFSQLARGVTDRAPSGRGTDLVFC